MTSKIAPQMKDLFFLGLALYKAKGLYQYALIASTGALAVPFLDAFKKYLVPNFDNIVVFIILMFLDVLSGVWKHSGKWDKDAPNTLDKNKFFSKLTSKTFAALVWLMLTNIFEKYTITDGLGSEYFNMFGISVLISWLSWSISENLHTVTKGAFPPIGLIRNLYNREKNETFNDKPPKDEN